MTINNLRRVKYEMKLIENIFYVDTEKISENEYIIDINKKSDKYSYTCLKIVLPEEYPYEPSQIFIIHTEIPNICKYLTEKFNKNWVPYKYHASLIYELSNQLKVAD